MSPLGNATISAADKTRGEDSNEKRVKKPCLVIWLSILARRSPKRCVSTHRSCAVAQCLSIPRRPATCFLSELLVEILDDLADLGPPLVETGRRPRVRAGSR